VANLHKRVGALEEYLNSRVGERMEKEWEEVLDRLEEHLPHEEAVRAMRILAGDEYVHGEFSETPS